MVLKDRLRKLDAHSSVPTEFRVYTASGAILSVVTIVIVLYLLVTEAYFNFQVTLEERVHVSATSPDGLELEFDLTLPHVPCQYLNVDANDPAGQSQSLHLDQEHHVWKHRLKYENGKSKLIGARKKLELGSTLLTEGDLIEHMEDLEEEFDDDDDEASTVQDTKAGDKGSDVCGSCYGAGEEGECCDTCDDVQRAYRRKGWVLQDLDGVKQCKGGAEIDMAGEGCNVHGVVALSTGGGNLHLAPGKQSRDSVHPNVLDLLFQSMQEWNVTHTLHKIRFGPHYPAATYQLDQQMRSIQDNYGMYQYYFKVVPTTYRFLNGTTIQTNQYSVTEHLRHVNPGSGRGLPGVFFFYEVSPLHVEITETYRQGWVAFFTSVCAVIGGVVSVMGMVDQFLFAQKRTDGLAR